MGTYTAILPTATRVADITSQLWLFPNEPRISEPEITWHFKQLLTSWKSTLEIHFPFLLWTKSLIVQMRKQRWGWKGAHNFLQIMQLMELGPHIQLSVTNLNSILKSRDMTLPAKVRLVKAMVLPVVIYGYESWTVKKAECWRTDAFKLWFLEKTLESPLNC